MEWTDLPPAKMLSPWHPTFIPTLSMNYATHYSLPPVESKRMVSHYFMDVGAADKAAIQLVEVQPYQLLVSDT